MDANTHDHLTIKAVKKVAPCVVSLVMTKQISQLRDVNPAVINPYIKAGQGDQAVPVGGGSGFIVHPNGLILTNKHVVFDPDAEYTAVLSDGSEHATTIVSRDPVNDIAFLKIKSMHGLRLPHALLASTHNVELGQTVIAIGNALGLFSNTVSKGIISGLARTISASLGSSPEGHVENLRGVIQTDVAINSGNSGGPLVNLDGEVIGINTAVIFGAQNIGFALPIDWARQDLKDIIAHGRIIKPYLGLVYIMLTPMLAKRLSTAVDCGALIMHDQRPGMDAVIAGSPAHRAGLRENDIITELDDKPIKEDGDLMDMLQYRHVGDKIKLTFLRDGKKHECRVTLEERR